MGFVSGDFSKRQLATELTLRGLERLLSHGSHVYLYQEVAQMTGNRNGFPMAFRCPPFPLPISIAFILIIGLWVFSAPFLLLRLWECCLFVSG